MVKIKFVLRDVPEDQRVKIIDTITLNDSIGKVKGMIRKAYSINQLFTIMLMHQGTPLEDKKLIKEYDLTSGKVVVSLIKTSDMRGD